MMCMPASPGGGGGGNRCPLPLHPSRAGTTTNASLTSEVMMPRLGKRLQVSQALHVIVALYGQGFPTSRVANHMDPRRFGRCTGSERWGPRRQGVLGLDAVSGARAGRLGTQGPSAR